MQIQEKKGKKIKNKTRIQDRKNKNMIRGTEKQGPTYSEHHG